MSEIGWIFIYLAVFGVNEYLVTRYFKTSEAQLYLYSCFFIIGLIFIMAYS